MNQISENTPAETSPTETSPDDREEESQSHAKSRRLRKNRLAGKIVRCHFCDCRYDPQRFEKCYKCGASHTDRKTLDKIRSAVRNFFSWFLG